MIKKITTCFHVSIGLTAVLHCWLVFAHASDVSDQPVGFQPVQLSHPGDISREEYERKLNDAVRALGNRQREIRKEIVQIQGEVSSAGTETPLETRKKQAERLLTLLKELEELDQSLQQYRTAIDTYLGTPILRLVEVKPAGVPGRSDSLSAVDKKICSIKVSQAPLEIIPGNTARFVMDVKQRQGWNFAAQCADPQYRSRPDDINNKVTGILSVNKSWADWHEIISKLSPQPHVLTWGRKEFARFCDYAPTYRDSEAGYAKQVPFELEDQVQFTVTLQPDRFPHENAYRFRGEARSSGRHTVTGFDGSRTLIKAAYADSKGYCTSGDGGCPDLFLVIGGSNFPLVFHYRHVRTGERYITSLPEYNHPASFDTPLFVGEPPTMVLALPDFIGKSLHEANKWLDDNKLKMLAPKTGSPAPTREKSGTIQAQEPDAGTVMKADGTVTFTVYSEYVPTREEQVANTDCSRFRGSRAYWDDAAQKPLCGCFEGLQWNLAKTQCVTVEVQASEVCTRKWPGSVPMRKKADGNFDCGCPQGYTWAADRTHCEKLIPVEELCARNYPGSIPTTSRDVNGNVICGCPQGYVWDSPQHKRCVQQSTPEEVCARKWPGSVPMGIKADGNFDCGCPQGYTWAAGRTHCEKLIPLAELCARNYPGSVPTNNRDANGNVICVCPQGYAWDSPQHRRCIQQTGTGSGGSGQKKKCYVWCTESGICTPSMFGSNPCSKEWWAQNKARIKTMQECPCEGDSGNGGSGGGPDSVCPPGYYRGSDGTCAPVGSGTFGQ
ncbi:MAG: PASTA domain-containing protein [Nitrospirota bacterium]